MRLQHRGQIPTLITIRRLIRVHQFMIERAVPPPSTRGSGVRHAMGSSRRSPHRPLICSFSFPGKRPTITAIHDHFKAAAGRSTTVRPSTPGPPDNGVLACRSRASLSSSSADGLPFAPVDAT
jgi:hypothetical protein